MRVALPVADIGRAARDTDLIHAVAATYDEVDARIARKAPVCVNRGWCCRFGAFGHRLYVTSTELAYFLSGFSDDLRAGSDDGYCPYQVAGRCHARQHRPLGCRIFFCDVMSQGWQSPLTERTLGRLRTIGDVAGLPYVYIDWTEALRAMGGVVTPDEADPPVAGGLVVSIDTRRDRS